MRLISKQFSRFCFTLLASCLLVSCARTTRSWHRESAVRGSPEETWNPYLGVERRTAKPPRGPSVSAAQLKTIRVEDSGDEIYAATRPSHPYYDHKLMEYDLAFVSTVVDGKTYEVAFRYEPNNTGRIAEISYLPVPK